MLRIKYFGHACFTIEKDGFIIALDPFKDVVGYKDIDITANAVYCSHAHYDHNYTDGVKLLGGVNPFKVAEIKTYHDDVKGAKRGENTIRVFEADSLRIAHFGDLGCDLSKEEESLLSNLDCVLIPVGGTYTIDAKKAKEILEKINPRIIIPMHYRSDRAGFDNIAHINDFLSLYESFFSTPSTLDIDKDNKKGIYVMDFEG